jgi:hypothetical protein
VDVKAFWLNVSNSFPVKEMEYKIGFVFAKYIVFIQACLKMNIIILHSSSHIVYVFSIKSKKMSEMNLLSRATVNRVSAVMLIPKHFYQIHGVVLLYQFVNHNKRACYQLYIR